MEAVTFAPAAGPAKSMRGADILSAGFGTTVAMWGVGYVCRMPPAVVPSPVVLVLMLGCLAVGGYFAGKYSALGWKAGLLGALLAAGLNLLILGSLISGDEPNQVTPMAVLWLSGWFALAAFIGGVSGLAGSRTWRPLPPILWEGFFARVAVGATFLLIMAGGLVTSHDAGLAVVDWPNSFGYNMFLYPISRMTGGIYYEHAHRLFGSLVGLTTVVFAIHLCLTDSRKWLKGLAVAAVLAVIAQGIMGGLRVTGKFTMSTSPEETSPSLLLALVHGVFGQVFFAFMVAMAVFRSRAWVGSRPGPNSLRRKLDLQLAYAFNIALLAQIVLGAMQRHYNNALIAHLCWAAVVGLTAYVIGIRAWGLYPDQKLLSRFGLVLVITTTFQISLGFAALIATVPSNTTASIPPFVTALIPTLHQALGAILLGTSAGINLWLHRQTEN